MDTSEYLGLFLDESREHLQELNGSLLDLERDPADRETLKPIFRVAHSLKGMSATMGFDNMARLTHCMEEVLSGLRDGEEPVTGSLVDTLFACLDTLEGMVEDVAAGGEGTADTTDLVARLKGLNEGAEATAQAAATVAPPAPSPAEAEPEAEPPVASPELEGLSEYDQVRLGEILEGGQRVFCARVVLEPACVLKAARAFMAIQALECLGEIVRTEPDTGQIEADELDEAVAIWVAGELDGEEVAAAGRRVSEVASVEVSELHPEARSAASAEGPDATAATGRPVAAPAAGGTTAPASRAEDGVPRERAKAAASTVRVGTDRLDSLMNLMGEMVIQRTRLSQLSGEHGLNEVRSAVEEMTRVTNDLQGLIMQVRMTAVDAVFMRFPRMVRDLAQSTGKQLELVISGEDTELDRTVIDELGDPLVHLLRNAVDHGLETPVERVAAGKDPKGTVWLRAGHAGNSVVIEVEEDGRGIDPARVRDAVVEKGLMGRAEADALDDSQAVELVFLPGFSTAKETTDVSGRGVGMDAVRSKIQGLNGAVEIQSQFGSGSTFTIRLPLTLAIIQALLVRSGTETYALPLEAIEETVVVSRDETRPVNGRDCMVLRDRIVPLVTLQERLMMAGDGEVADELSVVVVRAGASRVGVIVDEMVGQQDIVIKHLPSYLGDVAGVAGATLLGDGSVALIVDVSALGGPAVQSAAVAA